MRSKSGQGHQRSSSANFKNVSERVNLILNKLITVNCFLCAFYFCKLRICYWVQHNNSTQKDRGMSSESDEKRIFKIDLVDQKLWAKM